MMLALRTRTRGVRGLVRFAVVATLAVVLCASATARADSARDCARCPRPIQPALLTEISKDPARADDFLRFGFLPVGLVPTELAGPDAIRTFMTYSAFFEPALPVTGAVRLVGLEPVAERELAVYRCKDPNLGLLDPVLAKWPEVLAAIVEDFGGKYTCPPTTSAPENEILCIAETFKDTPVRTVTEALANLYDIAAMITSHPSLQDTVRKYYGIDLGFSGLGLAIDGSGAPQKFTAEGALDEAIVPEYLVRNVSIAAAGCHCILVRPYPGRDRDPLDPDFVWEEGTPACRFVDRLRVARDACPPHGPPVSTPVRRGWDEGARRTVARAVKPGGK